MLTDLRFALRTLLKTPGFTLVAVLTIAVGIGANTALFSVFDRLILRPTSFPQPSSLVAIWAINNDANFVAPALSWARYEEISAHTTSFSSVANSAFDNFTLNGNGDPEQLNSLRVTASFFPTLGVPVLAGRNFTAADDVPNGPAVCIISHELWQTRFGGRANLLGENIRLNGQPWQVVGILPPHFSNPFSQVQVFVPRVFEVSGLTALQVQVGAGYSQPIARLKPGISLAAANTELAALSKHYGELYPAKLDAPNLSEARDYNAALTGPLRPTFYTLVGAVGFVLLIACANVTSLFLGRLAARHKEIAVRQSLGASRGQIVRQFVVESLVFSALAGVIGVLLALWSLKAIETVVSTQLPPRHRPGARLVRAGLHGRRHAPQRTARRPRAGAAGFPLRPGRGAEGQHARLVRGARGTIPRCHHRQPGGAFDCAARGVGPAAAQLHPPAAHAAGF